MTPVSAASTELPLIYALANIAVHLAYRFVAKVLEEERRELTNLQEDVTCSLKEQKVIAENTIARNPKTDVAQKIIIA